MNVHAAALADAHLPDEQTCAFARDAIEGLSQQPKQLPPKHFYDATGSELFEAITRLPEYYPTRTELAILSDRAGEIAAFVPQGAALVEFGAGATTKVRLLLQNCAVAAYVPVDISGDFIRAQADELRKDFPTLGVYPVAADITTPFRLPEAIAEMPKVGFFPGLDDRPFRTSRSLPLPAERSADPGPGSAHDHRRRPGEGRARALQGL